MFGKMTMHYIGEWVEYSNCSLNAISKETGIPVEKLEKIVGNEEPPTLWEFNIISNFLNVSLDDLMHRNPKQKLSETDFRTQFINFIRCRNLNDTIISNETGIDPIIVKSWIDGARVPSLNEFFILAETLNVSLDELMGKDAYDIFLYAIRKLPHNKNTSNFIFQTSEFLIMNRVRSFMGMNTIPFKVYAIRDWQSNTIDHFMIVYHSSEPIPPDVLHNAVKKMNTKQNRKLESTDPISEEKYLGIEFIDR